MPRWRAYAAVLMVILPKRLSAIAATIPLAVPDDGSTRADVTG
jgi:hypothetical protein